MHFKSGLVVSLSLICQWTIAGEATYQETTKITGGSVVGLMKFAEKFSKQSKKIDQPTVTTVAVKGNRMARVSEDHAEIIDLDAETITQIDKINHQYSTVTFTQMKQAMEQALEKAKTEQANHRQTAPTPTPQDPNVELSFDAHVRQTGVTKQISGIDASEVILTLAVSGKDKNAVPQSGQGNVQQAAMAVTSDMWMAADLPGYAEVREFNRRFGVKMGAAPGGGPDISALVQQAGASDAMKTLAKESAKLQGVPVLQVMRMGMTVNGAPLPAASEAALPGNNAAGQSDAGPTLGSEVARTTTNAAQQTAAQEAAAKIGGPLGNGLSSAIGGFGSFRRKKKPAAQDTAAEPVSSPQTGAVSSSSTTQPPTSAVLLESTTEVGNFSQHVDPATMEIPAGYKLVPSAKLN